MTARKYRLTDRYVAESGQVFLSGVQALARIPIEQLRKDRDAGMNTAAFVSGYPGSPLGGFDQELARALAVVGDLPIVHLPAVNEELAASAVMGSQLASTRPDAIYDGVVGIWYGKAPGLDRATDALRHAVFAGSSSTGGALAIVGDDPAAKSSTMPSSSDAALVDLHMPILYPATVGECLELGLHGVAMSRATGLWSSLKIVTPVADGTGTVDLDALGHEPVIPTTIVDGRIWRPHPSAQFLGPRMVELEQEFHEIRSELALRYGVDNGLNRVTTSPPDAWLGIVSTGYTYTQVLESLRRLGLSDLDEIAGAGIRLLHLRMPVPFAADQVIDFAKGLSEIIVVEEKNPTLERLVRDCLYDATVRPLVIGKKAPDGTKLLPSYGLLDADAITPALRSRLEGVLRDRLTEAPPQPRELIPLTIQRTPFFCSGCPHNWGTKVPEGAVVGMGTGCHGMTLLMDEERVGESIGITAMGNEGAQWLGMSPFVETDHVFQNFGDGTYFHSGQLAIQAAIGAGANMTFKILYNHTVAMTGGQDASHRIGPADLASVLLTHGVKRVAITTEDVSRYRGEELPAGVKVSDRTRIIEVQEQLRAVQGVTVLIHDQGCSNELRRARRRGTIDKPTTRVVINHRICEGCGDCGDVSNCLSVQPVDTPLGRKTQIDQDSCNLDLTCLQGDCPAFMTVDVDSDDDALFVGPDPDTTGLADPSPIDRVTTTVRLAGIGGTGVVTTAHMLGIAAMLSGLEIDGVDQTGLSQKAGPVISDLTFTKPGIPHRSNLLGRQQGDVLIAFDMLVATSDAAINVGSASKTVVFASSSTTPTGAQISEPTMSYPTTNELLGRLDARTDRHFTVDSRNLARTLTGSTATANTLIIGIAVQAGELPVELGAIREAIRLNGVAVQANLLALEWGRRWFTDPNGVEALGRERDNSVLRVDTPELPTALDRRIRELAINCPLRETVVMFAADLVGYQDEAYAERFLELVERTCDLDDPGLTEAVARNFHKLMAYKDEYEVARLMLGEDGLAPAQDLSRGRGGGGAVTWHLHPPILKTLGFDHKLRLGSRTAPLFHLLAKAKRLRGTAIDPFGRTAMRRLERAMIDEYEVAIRAVTVHLATTADPQDRHDARDLAQLPDSVRGFEELKMKRAGAYRRDLAASLDELLTNPGSG